MMSKNNYKMTGVGLSPEETENYKIFGELLHNMIEELSGDFASYEFVHKEIVYKILAEYYQIPVVHIKYALTVYGSKYCPQDFGGFAFGERKSRQYQESREKRGGKIIQKRLMKKGIKPWEVSVRLYKEVLENLAFQEKWKPKYTNLKNVF